MKTITKLSLAATAALAAYSAPSQAAVLFDNGTFKLDDTNLGGQPVNLNSISADKKTVYGDYNGQTVSFTSTADLDFNQGAATIFALANKATLADLTVNIAAPGYNQAGFALAGGSTFNLLVNGTTLISNITIPNGNNAFTLTGSGIQTLAFTFTNPGIDTEKQFRLSGLSTAAVPEPTTWAMLIAGLGIVGASMRRRKTAVSFA
ncbi:MAG: PEPxxWA-CTERM sorting domain-containing protein [Sphingobium sp.]|nr:PEPxxWA-CTERM sorting domain-containing protein [Sphingobium sp.]